METSRVCTRCKKTLSLSKFKIKHNGEYQKSCKECAQKRRQYVNKRLGRKIKQKNKESSKECKVCGVTKNISSYEWCGINKYTGKKYYKNTCKVCFYKNKCTRCRKHFVPDTNILYCGKPLKSCEQCRYKYKCPHSERTASNKCKICINEKKQIHRQQNKCIHNKRKYSCKECDFEGFLKKQVRCRMNQALKRDKKNHSLEYLGCDVNTFKKHIEDQFKPNMSWENYGSEWHIDHIVPLKYDNPTLEQTIERLHYTNTQPLWATENMSKGNRYIG